MTPERAKLLGELLTELAEDPRGFIPDEAYLAAQKAFALSYIELAIVRRGPQGVVQILLTHRTDTDWNGWHIPGGMWRTRKTLEEGIAGLAKTEQLGEDAKLTFLAKGTWEKWHDHPIGVPISHVAICLGEGIVETEKMKWFDGVPEGMIDDHGHHAGFIKDVFRRAYSLL